MAGSRAEWLVLLLFAAGCGATATVRPDADRSATIEELSTNTAAENSTVGQSDSETGSGGLAFLKTYDVEFIHYALRQKVERIDRLAREHGLPAENTIEWSRRPPSVNDNRKLHSFVAKWSSHNNQFYALQPDQRPGSEIFVIADVDPANTNLIRSFSLSARSQCKREGWDADVSLFCQPYQRDRLGEETLRFAFRRSEDTPVIEWIEWPIRAWYVTLPNKAGDPLGQEIAVRTEIPSLTRTQIREALATTAGFRDEVRRELKGAKERLLQDISASRNVRIIEPRYTTPIPDASRIERRELDPPDGFKLTVQQKRKLAQVATSELDRRGALFDNNCQEMYVAVMRAFPIYEYLAGE
jgi:hypothetical protein